MNPLSISYICQLTFSFDSLFCDKVNFCQLELSDIETQIGIGKAIAKLENKTSRRVSDTTNEADLVGLPSVCHSESDNVKKIDKNKYTTSPAPRRA